MKNKDALLGKISNIRNCLASIKAATELKPESLDDQFTQDVFVLNLERAAQASIDMANLWIARSGWELPRSYKHSFNILAQQGLISAELSERLGKMAGFRNIAVHDYTKLNAEILKSILTKNLSDLEDFCKVTHKQLMLEA